MEYQLFWGRCHWSILHGEYKDLFSQRCTRKASSHSLCSWTLTAGLHLLPGVLLYHLWTKLRQIHSGLEPCHHGTNSVTISHPGTMPQLRISLPLDTVNITTGNTKSSNYFPLSLYFISMNLYKILLIINTRDKITEVILINIYTLYLWTISDILIILIKLWNSLKLC